MFASIERSNNSSMGTKFHSSGEGRARNFVERVRKRNRRKSKMFLRHFARYSPLILPAKIFLAHFHNVILEGKKKKKRKSNVTPRHNYFPHFQFTPSTSSNPPSALHCPRSGGRWKFMESENFSENSRLRSDGIKVAMCTCKFILNETR